MHQLVTALCSKHRHSPPAMYFMTLSSPPTDRAWHAQDNGAVFAALAADENGLSAHEAQARLRRFGHNRLRPPPRRGPTARFLLQFNNLLIYSLRAPAAYAGDC